MSEENVEIVRGIYDGVTRRDEVTPYEVYGPAQSRIASGSGSRPRTRSEPSARAELLALSLRGFGDRLH
jgi:hypothetical protein